MSLYTFQTNGHVEFYDCDPMGVVWHGNYLRYLEKARGEFLDFIGYSYYSIDADGYFFPIVEERMKYLKSLRLGDSFIINLHLDEYENRLVHSFEIVLNGEICVKGRTVQVALKKGAFELDFFMPKNFIRAIESLPLAK